MLLLGNKHNNDTGAHCRGLGWGWGWGVGGGGVWGILILLSLSLSFFSYLLSASFAALKV